MQISVFLQFYNTLLSTTRPPPTPYIPILFIQLGFSPCKAEQSLQGMELKNKKSKAYRKAF